MAESKTHTILKSNTIKIKHNNGKNKKTYDIFNNKEKQ